MLVGETEVLCAGLALQAVEARLLGSELLVNVKCHVLALFGGDTPPSVPAGEAELCRGTLVTAGICSCCCVPSVG